MIWEQARFATHALNIYTYSQNVITFPLKLSVYSHIAMFLWFFFLHASLHGVASRGRRTSKLTFWRETDHFRFCNIQKWKRQTRLKLSWPENSSRRNGTSHHAIRLSSLDVLPHLFERMCLTWNSGCTSVCGDNSDGAIRLRHYRAPTHNSICVPRLSRTSDVPNPIYARFCCNSFAYSTLVYAENEVESRWMFNDTC